MDGHSRWPHPVGAVRRGATDGRDEADPGSLTLAELGARLADAAEQLQPVGGYVSAAQTVTDVVNIFSHVAAGGLHG